MNGYPAPGQYGQPPPSVWQEHKTPDGRAYYYNPTTKVTQWTKPEEMMTPAERALANQPWKEYTAEGGRKYWYNTETKQSSWEMPDVYKSALGSETSQATAPAAQHGGHGYDDRRDQRNHDDYRDSRDRRDYDDRRDYRDRDYRDRDRDRGRDRYDDRDYIPESRQLPAVSDPKAKAFVPASNDPDYASHEEAEAAFHKLLKRSGVQPDWTWEQAIRATARDPQFRAIKDPKDRKAAFNKYCEDVRVQNKERVKERLTKLRADFETMLKRHPEITHYTRWKTARPMIEGETIFRSTDSEEERRQLFEEYIIGLKKAHAEQEVAMRKSASDTLVDVLRNLDLEPSTRWYDARGMITSKMPFEDGMWRFQNDSNQTLNQVDVLLAFQNHMKALERSFNDSKQDEKNKKARKERKARDSFKSLLNNLRKEGRINAGTKWDQIMPLLENEKAYLAMLGQGGSTPQELFWDIVEDEERGLRGPRNDVLDVLEDKRYDLTANSDLDEFLSLMKEDRRTANIDRKVLEIIFDRLREKRQAKREDEKQPDRHQRRAIDDLRAYLKRLDPPVTLDDTYDKVRPQLTKSEEFQAVSSEDFRRLAFDKHIRRLREKEEEAEQRSTRRRDYPSPERDFHRRDRDRSRGERSHRGERERERRGSRRSRSPEIDAYEADRRKAIAEREKNHRKTTMAEGLLSTDRDRDRRSPPPPSRRDRDRDSHRERERDRERDRDRERERERYRDDDRPPRPRRDSDGHYERERRDREEDRERYRRRAERGSYDEVTLQYGDERPSGSRRRRPEDEDETRRDSRDSKRIKREKSPEPATKAAPAEKKSPPAEDVKSGSEEGEIEEDD